MKEALFYESSDYSSVQCRLCSHNCIVKNGEKGICNVRKNDNGILYSLVYGKIAAKNIDPIEKKPLYHFKPRSYTYSFSTTGCNLKCKNCQNYEISQTKEILGAYYSPDAIVGEVVANHLPSISYTYTEPTIYYEFAKDTGLLAKKESVCNIFVSNGFMTKEVVKDSSEWIDAINIDLKSFFDDFYKKLCKASVKPVLENISSYKESGVWVEITTLLIPEYNDSEKEISQIAKFIKSIDKNIPWHISAFYPTYLLTNTAPTNPEKVKNARLIGLAEGLNFVYTGNIRYPEGETTFCPVCGELLVSRVGYSVNMGNFERGKCVKCGNIIAGVF